MLTISVLETGFFGRSVIAMKLAFFNNFTLGVVKGDKIVDISKAVPVNEHNLSLIHI